MSFLNLDTIVFSVLIIGFICFWCYFFFNQKNTPGCQDHELPDVMELYDDMNILSGYDMSMISEVGSCISQADK
jgi:hypothetical protein